MRAGPGSDAGAGFDYAAHGLRAPERRPAIPGGGPQSVAELLDRAVAERPGEPALVGRSGRFTWARLDAGANAAAGALAALGVRTGDRVAACLPNDVDLVLAFLGCMRMGALWVGVNRALAPPEQAFLLRDAGAVVWLATPDAADALAPLRGSLPELAHVVPVDPGGPRDAWRARLSAAEGAPRPAHAVDPFAPAAIAYTSGTTGEPKGAVHSQHNLLLPGAVTLATGRHPPGLAMGVVLPMTILNLLVLGPLVAFQYGNRCVAIDRLDPEGLAGWIRRERVGTFVAVPTVFHDLLTHPGVAPEALASVVVPEVGGAECPEAFRALFRARFGREVRIGYGMTEAPTAVAWSDGAEAPAPGLCGRPLPQVELAIAGDDGRRLPAGEVGEICIGPAREGPWAGVYTPMLGYWRRPDATTAAFRDGTYRTGDLGLLAEDGNLYVRGRRNELILRGGANVYPAEVERVLAECPGVAGSAVFGVPDPRLGERVVAAVEPAPGAALSPSALLAFLRPRLARYKLPERIALVARLPRNAMGKVRKRELAPLFEVEDGEEGPGALSR
jgi:acyl-CoA synthetase (AMP-forming)/AMP-acid ligase II